MNDAIQFIEEYNQENGEHPFIRYMIIIKYNNHDKIEAEFNDKLTALSFLRNYQPAEFQPAD